MYFCGIKYLVLNYPNKFIEKTYTIIENLNKKFSKFGDQEFFSVNDFPWISKVEEYHSDIKKELEYLLEHPEKIPNLQKIFTDEEFLCKEDKWKSFVFRIGGDWIEEHRKLCPKTSEALSLIPSVKTAFFSIFLKILDIFRKKACIHRKKAPIWIIKHLSLLIPL